MGPRILSLLLLAAACSSSPEGGGGGGGGGAGGSGGIPPPPDFSVCVDQPRPTIELRATGGVMVWVTPAGEVGTVDLQLSGLPADITGELESTKVSLDGETAVAVPITLTTLAGTQTGSFPFEVIATGNGKERRGPATLTVKPVITFRIPDGVAALTGDEAFGDYPTVIRALPDMSAENAIHVRFFNADTVEHTIQGRYPDQGFPQGQPFGPGSFEAIDRAVNAPGTYDWYLHDVGPQLPGRFVIQ